MRRIQDEESDGEDQVDESQDRDAIAMDLFSDDVSYLFLINNRLSDLKLNYLVL